MGRTLREDVRAVGREIQALRRAASERFSAPPQRHGTGAPAAASHELRAVAREVRALAEALLSLVLAPDPPPRARRRGRLRWLSRYSRLLLWVVALLLFLAGVPAVAASFRVPLLLAPVLSALYALPAGLVVTGPLLAWRLTAVIGLIGPVVAAPMFPTSFPWPVTQAIAACLVCYAVALRHHWRVVLAVWGATSAVMAWGLLIRFGPGGILAMLSVAAGLVGLVMLLGHLVGARRQVEQSLDVEERRREESETQRALLEERTRIARELHDVVAHHMSMISVQAETAPYRIPDLGDQGKQSFADIAQTARGALQEMRRVLGVLRDKHHDAERAPQPGLSELDDLVAGARRAGVSVETVVRGSARSLPQGLELSAYRIVQEGLSNAAWHSPNAGVVVGVHYEERRLRVRVSNEAPPGGVAPPRPDRGQGLIGMRERASMHGGTLSAGHTEDGGYVVDAVLPYPDEVDAQ